MALSLGVCIPVQLSAHLSTEALSFGDEEEFPSILNRISVMGVSLPPRYQRESFAADTEETSIKFLVGDSSEVPVAAVGGSQGGPATSGPFTRTLPRKESFSVA